MHGVQNTEKRLLHSNKRRCADIRPRSEAKHCSSLCSQSEGDEYCGGQARAENPTKSCSRALVMFATCSWPSLCEQSELQCWRRNRRLCGPAHIFDARALLPIFYLEYPKVMRRRCSPYTFQRTWDEARQNAGRDAIERRRAFAIKYRDRIGLPSF